LLFRFGHRSGLLRVTALRGYDAWWGQRSVPERSRVDASRDAARLRRRVGCAEKGRGVSVSRRLRHLALTSPTRTSFTKLSRSELEKDESGHSRDGTRGRPRLARRVREETRRAPGAPRGVFCVLGTYVPHLPSARGRRYSVNRGQTNKSESLFSF
jgi:hypothetical protein